MYYIKQSEWNRLEKECRDYVGYSITNPKQRVIFEGAIPDNNGRGGTTLLFEGLHFKVVPDREFIRRII